MKMEAPFKIFGICLVKNEADIIEYSLKEASKWADRIIVFDGESTDGTWEKVVAMKNERIVPWKSEDKIFGEGLRAEAFNAFRQEAQPGDWWCRLDADEIYIDDPREFLAGVKPPQHVVWAIALEYTITQEDLEKIDFSENAEIVLPKLQYYQGQSSEPRFFRYRKRLKWPENAAWPIHMGLVSPGRILYRHYQYRSPEQIRIRLATRQAAIARGALAKSYLMSKDWKEKIGNRAEMFFDARDGQFQLNHQLMPRHLEPFKARAVKWIMQTSGLWP